MLTEFQKKIAILCVALVAFIAATSAYFIRKTQRMEKALQQAETDSARLRREALPEPQRELVPAKPEDYGMVVTNDYTRPKTQEGWDNLMSEKIAQAKAETPPDALAKLKEQIQEDPSKTEEKIKQIDEKIGKLQASLQENPGNEEIQNEIDRLMMLKSIAKELP